MAPRPYQKIGFVLVVAESLLDPVDITKVFVDHDGFPEQSVLIIFD